jgi:hypothetical protein
MPLTDHVVLKPTPTLNALWALKGEYDGATIGRLFALLSGSLRYAAEIWPDAYSDSDATLRIVKASDSPPLPEFGLEASGRIEIVELASPQGECVLLCDLVVAEAPLASEKRFGAPVLAPIGADACRIFWVDSVLPLATSPPRAEPATPRGLARLLLAPPSRASERKKLRDFFAEAPQTPTRRFEYNLLLRLIGAKPSKQAVPATDEWARVLAVARQDRPECLATLERLLADHRRADALAVRYGDMWRSTSVARSFLLFLTSATSGLLGALAPEIAAYTIVVQLAANALIFFDRRLARRRRWREKWIDYRSLAEQLRLARFIVLANAVSVRLAPRTWVEWWVLRALRAERPAPGLSSAASESIVAHLLKTEISGQIAYQRMAFRRFRRLDAKMRRAGQVALGATLLVGAAVAGMAFLRSGVAGVPWKSVVSLALIAAPGLLSTLNGVRTAFDVERQAERAGRIATSLAALARAASGAPATPELARAIALQSADIMNDEVSRWRVTTSS